MHGEFHSVDLEIKSHIIQFSFNNTLRLKALQEHTLTLEHILTLYRTGETSNVEFTQILSEI